MHFYSLIYIFILMIGLTSCSLHRLNIQTQYLSHEELASYYVDTPDPRLDHPDIGQRLLIQWTLSKQDIDSSSLTLHLSIQLRNHQQKELSIPINKKNGFYIYDLLNQEYFESGGILTYYAEIRNAANCIITSWKHPLWTPLIQFDFPN